MRAEFAKNLVQLRQAAGISQRMAAEALQVSQALLSHYEKGIREPGLDFVVRAAEYYGVSTDHLLGTRLVREMPFPPPGVTINPPSEFANHIEQQLKDTMDVLMDLYNRNFNKEVFCYGCSYLAEALYELIRPFSRLSPTYDQNGFALDEERYLAGAVNSDMLWLRAQYTMAIRQWAERGGALPASTPEELQRRYGTAFESVTQVIRLVGERAARQDAAERNLSNAMFGAPDHRKTTTKSTPEEEDPQ